MVGQEEGSRETTVVLPTEIHTEIERTSQNDHHTAAVGLNEATKTATCVVGVGFRCCINKLFYRHFVVCRPHDPPRGNKTRGECDGGNEVGVVGVGRVSTTPNKHRDTSGQTRRDK